MKRQVTCCPGLVYHRRRGRTAVACKLLRERSAVVLESAVPRHSSSTRGAGQRERKHRHLSKRQPRRGLQTAHACALAHTRARCSLPPPPSLPQTRRTDSARLVSSHAHRRPPRADCDALNGEPQAVHGISSSCLRTIIAVRPASPTAIPTCRIRSHSGNQHASAAHTQARRHEFRAISVARTPVPQWLPTAYIPAWCLPAEPAARLPPR